MRQLFSRLRDLAAVPGVLHAAVRGSSDPPPNEALMKLIETIKQADKDARSMRATSGSSRSSSRPSTSSG